MWSAREFVPDRRRLPILIAVVLTSSAIGAGAGLLAPVDPEPAGPTSERAALPPPDDLDPGPQSGPGRARRR
jgi:hypothetical protein